MGASANASIFLCTASKAGKIFIALFWGMWTWEQKLIEVVSFARWLAHSFSLFLLSTCKLSYQQRVEHDFWSLHFNNNWNDLFAGDGDEENINDLDNINAMLNIFKQHHMVGDGHSSCKRYNFSKQSYLLLNIDEKFVIRQQTKLNYVIAT